MSYDPAFVWNRPNRNSLPPGRVRETAAPNSSGPDQHVGVNGNLDSEPAPHRIESPSPPAEHEAVLVPLDQWSRILSQLGNLHEAGQELAVARERAAKAETESTFLRERLQDMRQRVSELERAVADDQEPEQEPGFVEWLLRRRVQRRRDR